MSIASRAREEIQALKPYAAASQVDDTIRLNANEAPWASRDDRFRRPLNRYPEVRPTRLQAALARRYGCDHSELHFIYDRSSTSPGVGYHIPLKVLIIVLEHDSGSELHF